MKKTTILALALVLMIALVAFAACNKNDTDVSTD